MWGMTFEKSLKMFPTDKGAQPSMSDQNVIAELEHENRLLRARNDRLRQCEQAFNEWIEKTEWVQQTARPGELGRHRADVLKVRIEALQRELAVAESMHKVAVQQRDKAWRELADLSEAVAKRLEQAGPGCRPV